MSQPAKHNYLSNRELLQEIHLSKTSYCEYSQPHYHYPDAIVDCIDPAKVDQYLSQGLSVEEISQRITETACAHILKPATRKQALAARLRRESDLSYRSAVAQHEAGELEQKPKQAQHQIQLTEPQLPTPLVYRVFTYEHIPLDPDRRRTPRKLSEHYVKLNFIPFKHYIIDSDGAVVEVGRSHSLQGEFSQTHGALTDQLARMCMLLVQRYSQRANWRGYSYVEEMVGQSLLQLSSMALQFDESKSSNPFSYYTQAIQNSFTRVLNTEKKVQRARDEILINRGQTPSFGRQIEHEEQQRTQREAAENTDDQG